MKNLLEPILFYEKVVGTQTFQSERYWTPYISMTKILEVINLYEKPLGNHAFQ